jgi:kynureninase
MIVSREQAERADAQDPLRALRGAFDLPPGVIYLDGNSLGPPPRQALERLRRTADHEWKGGLIRSWNGHDGGERWIDLASRCGAKIAPLIGADAGDVIVCDSVSVNLFKLAAALISAGGRRALWIEEGEFPTDGYILDGLSRLTGAPLSRLEPGTDLSHAAGGVLVKSLAHYKTAAVADMAAHERNAQAHDAAIIWDLSHGAGVLDINVKAAGAKYAIGCGYKYMNGGPGAPAFIYVDGAVANHLDQPISGWMGHADPFAFGRDYAPASGVARFAAGTPQILSLSALDAALDIFRGVEMAALEQKARALGDLFIVRAREAGLSPIAVNGRRGGHVSIPHPNGYSIVQALIAKGVIGDFRAPDLMRFGFSPLFLSYAEVWESGDVLRAIMETEQWRADEYAQAGPVT